MDNVITIYEVRRNLYEAMQRLEQFNSHILSDEVGCTDYDSMRIAYTLLRDTFIAKWTNNVM